MKNKFYFFKYTENERSHDNLLVILSKFVPIQQ